MCNFISKPYFKNEFRQLFDIAKEHFIRTYAHNKLVINNSKKEFDKSNCDNIINTLIYRLSCKINYDNLPNLLEKTYNKLKLN